MDVTEDKSKEKNSVECWFELYNDIVLFIHKKHKNNKNAILFFKIIYFIPALFITLFLFGFMIFLISLARSSRNGGNYRKVIKKGLF